MRKYHSDLDPNASGRTRTRVPRVVGVVLLLMAAPLVYEGGQIVVCRWASLAGTPREARTPILDAMADWSRSLEGERQYHLRGFLNPGSWKPSTAVPFAIGWALVMSLVFLRRTH